MSSLVAEAAETPSARAERFLKRIAVLMVGTLGTALLSFATQLILSRTMAVPDYGRLAAMLAAVNVLTPVAVLGMGFYWLEVFGREGWRAVSWIAPAVRVASIASLASVVLLAAYVMVSDDSHGAHAALFAGLLIPVLLGQSLAETTAARLQLEERYFTLAAWQLLTQLGRALIAVGLLLVGALGMTRLLAGYAAVGAGIITISLMSLRQMRNGQFRLAGHGSVLDANAETALTPRQIATQAAPYSLITLSYVVVSQGVVAIVQFLLGSEAAAIYNVAFLVTVAIYLIPNVVYVKYLASKLLRWWAHDRMMFASVFHLGVVAHLVMGLGFAFLVAASAHELIPALFGPRYHEAAPILTILAVAIPIRFVQHAYGAALLSREHVGRKIRYIGSAAVACVVLNFALTPLFGLKGAAIAVVLSEAILLVLYYQGISRYVDGIDVKATLRVSTLRASLAYVGHGGLQA